MADNKNATNSAPQDGSAGKNEEGFDLSKVKLALLQTLGAPTIAPGLGTNASEELRKLHARHMPKRISLKDTEEKPEFLLEQEDGTGVLRRGMIQVIKAKPKNGKSHVGLAFIASALGYEGFGFRRRDGSKELNVIRIDTEQERADTHTNVQKVHELLGWEESEDNPRFESYTLRTDSIDERLLNTAELIMGGDYDLGVIDGVVDYVPDFNEVKPSKHVIETLDKVAGLCHVALICIIHTNKGRDDHNSRGHIGTIIEQKATETYEVSKVEHDDHTNFFVTASNCRNATPHDWGFTIDREGRLQPIDRGKMGEAKRDVASKRANELITKLLEEAGDAGCTRAEIVKELREKGGYSEKHAYRLIKDAADNSNGKALLDCSGKIFRLRTATSANKTINGIGAHEAFHDATLFDSDEE